MNNFMDPIRLICFNTSSVINLRRSMCIVVYLKCCSKWDANESDFCPFLRRRWTSEKGLTIIFSECMLCVTYVNIVTPRAFYFID